MDTVAEEIVVGTRVLKDGYKGTVIEVCAWDPELVVVRLPRGAACVPKYNFDGRYRNNRVLRKGEE